MRLISTLILTLLLAGLAGAVDYELVVRVLDDVTGLPVPARVRVVDSADSLRFAVAKDSCFYHPDRTGMIPANGYFFTSGEFAIDVPTGSTVIGASRGHGYTATLATVNVTADVSLEYTPQQWLDMPALGWYSADSHSHTNHPPHDYTIHEDDAAMVGLAEDLNVYNISSNGYYFTGTINSESTADHLIWYGEEMRHRKWGDIGVLGTSALVESTSYKTSWLPMLSHRAGTAHADNGLFIQYATQSGQALDSLEPHHARAREIPILLWQDKLDAMDMMCFSNNQNGRDLVNYYLALNTGHALPATAGTDAVVNQESGAAPGSFRSYAYLGETALTYSAWQDAVVAGKTFVTSGPLFTSFTLGAASTGDTLAFGHYTSTTLSGAFKVSATSPLANVQVVVNGMVAEHFTLGTTTVLDTTYSVTLTRPSWVAIRTAGVKSDWSTCGDSLFAHTSPVYVTMGGLMTCEPAAATRYSTWIDTLKIVLADNFGLERDVAESTAVYARLDSCDTYYSTMFGGRGIYTVGSGGEYGTLGSAIADAATGAGDTLVLLAGTHAAHFDSVALYDNMTLRGSTRDAEKYVIVNAAQNASAIDVSDATVLIQDLTFSDHRNGVFTTTAKAMIEVDDDADVTVRRCRFMDVDGYTAPGLYCLGDAAEAEVIDITFEDCYAESCDAASAVGDAAGVVYIANANAVTIDGCIFTGNSSGEDGGALKATGNYGHTNITNSLFIGNTCDDIGAAAALNTRNAYNVTVDYCTFDANTSATPAEGQLSVSQAAPTHTLSHSIITNGGSTYALANTSLFDVVSYVDSYGNGVDNLAWNSATGTDTIHIDPEYNCLDATTDCYRGNAPSVETCADGSFMGWLRGVQGRGRPIALGIRRRRDRR